MSCTVSLSEFVSELEMSSEQVHVSLNRETGEFFALTDEDIAAAEDEDDEDIPEWQKEQLPKIRDALASDDWVQLPSKWHLDEYRIMRDFCGTVANQALRGDLFDTIGGQGIFGRFKSMVHRHNLLKRWGEFRDAALRRFAMDWLRGPGIAYRE